MDEIYNNGDKGMAIIDHLAVNPHTACSIAAFHSAASSDFSKEIR